jgi:hypothetical protein
MIKIFLFFSLGFLVSLIFEKTTKKWALWDEKVGWQFHHSLFGLGLILVALILGEYQIELISAGVGIIVQHTFSDGFVFLRRWQ